MKRFSRSSKNIPYNDDTTSCFYFLTKWLTSFLFLYIFKPCLLTYLGITCQLNILFFCLVHWFFLFIFRMLVIVLTASTTPFVNLVLQVRDIDACVLLDLQDPIANKVRQKCVHTLYQFLSTTKIICDPYFRTNLCNRFLGITRP